jgi:hypothetical protein
LNFGSFVGDISRPGRRLLGLCRRHLLRRADVRGDAVIVSLSGAALVANVVSVTLLVVETVSYRRQ